MSGAERERFDEGWLSLREPADARARAVELLVPLRAHFRSRDPAARTVSPAILDLGSGTGSTTRWLAPQLAGPQRWTLLDHNQDLLRYAAARCSEVRDATGRRVELYVRNADLADLDAPDLGATDLVTASALLDLLTRAEIETLATQCAAAGCAALLTLSVSGQVTLDPPDALDAALVAAFNAHQCRTSGDRMPLGPDAVSAAAAAFAERGHAVRVAASPWRLGPGSEALTGAWLEGWLDAAKAQEPALATDLIGYRARRATQIESGRLRVEVEHRDLLALPAPKQH